MAGRRCGGTWPAGRPLGPAKYTRFLTIHALRLSGGPYNLTALQHRTAMKRQPSIPAGSSLCWPFNPALAHAWLAAIPLLAASAAAGDVGMVAVLKGQRFKQESQHIVALGEWDRNAFEDEAEPPLAFEAFVAGEVLSATVQVPGGAVLPLEREEPTDEELRREDAFATLLDLDGARPDGSYTFTVDGLQSFSVDLAGGDYPPVPQVTNWQALQAVAAGGAATVEWSPMGGTAQDFILLGVEDAESGETVYQSGEPGAGGALDGTATQAVIPAGALQAGRDYDAELLFVRVADVDAGETLAVAGYSKMVGFNISVAPTPGVPTGARFAGAVPGNGAGDVPRDSAVAFRFSKPMDPTAHAVGWRIDGTASSAFTYQWIEGDTVLLCRPGGVLPAGVEVEWSLDPGGFRDAAGFAPSGAGEGSFRTGEDAECPPDVNGVFVLKQREFSQTGATPVPTGTWDSEVGLSLGAFNRVRSATVTVVANGRTASPDRDPWDPEMYIDGDYASKADLDRFFANGDYQFVLDTLADGSNKNVTLTLGPADAYPDAPVVANVAALQGVDPAAPVTITWGALPGWSVDMGVGSGVIELEIERPGGDEVVWVEGPGLNPGGTSFTIPAGTLWPGRTYQAYLHFIRIADLEQDAYPDAFGAAGFESTTRFTVQTAGTPVLPALALQPNGTGMDVLAAGGEHGTECVLETSPDMIRWLPQATLWIWEDAGSYWDGDAHYLGKRFYRLRDRLEGEEVWPHITIQGTVWSDGSRTTPVAGATVGTDLDSRTVVTDAAGRFFLETDTPTSDGSGGQAYTIKVTTGSGTASFGPGIWGDQPREQHFELP